MLRGGNEAAGARSMAATGKVMLTKLTIRNFKRFRDVEIELGSPVVFIGPNNSGKDLRDAGAGAMGRWSEAMERALGRTRKHLRSAPASQSTAET